MPINHEFWHRKYAKKVSDLELLGYTHESVLKMTCRLPQIYNYSIPYIKSKIECLIDMGYDKKSVLKMTTIFPSLFGYKTENIEKRFRELVELGYSPSEIIHMTLLLPSIYGFSIDNIKSKKVFYDSIGLSQLIVLDPKQLMQSVELSYARYMFYISIGENIDMSNYPILFMSQSRFKKRYGISNTELINMYNYNDYIDDYTSVRSK